MWGMKKTAARPYGRYDDTIIQMTQDYCFIHFFGKGCGAFSRILHGKLERRKNRSKIAQKSFWKFGTV
jgi:hypothetical protein